MMYLLCISNVSGMLLPRIPMHLQCISDVSWIYHVSNTYGLSMYFEGIGCELTENFDVLVEY